METISWTVDWNPEFEDETRLKREILEALKDERILETIKRLGEQAAREAKELGLETEHIIWLESSYSYAFYVRVWYETSEHKVFIIIEENDLNDVGFLLLHDLECASYNDDKVLRVEFREPEDLGVQP